MGRVLRTNSRLVIFRLTCTSHTSPVTHYQSHRLPMYVHVRTSGLCRSELSSSTVYASTYSGSAPMRQSNQCHVIHVPRMLAKASLQWQ